MILQGRNRKMKKKKYMLNVNGEIYRNISYEEATKLINSKVKTEYDWFYLYEEKVNVQPLK